jgi:hypothetical protein
MNQKKMHDMEWIKWSETIAQHKIGGVYLSREQCSSGPLSSIACKNLILESEIWQIKTQSHIVILYQIKRL